MPCSLALFVSFRTSAAAMIPARAERGILSWITKLRSNWDRLHTFPVTLLKLPYWEYSSFACVYLFITYGVASRNTLSCIFHFYVVARKEKSENVNDNETVCNSAEKKPRNASQHTGGNQAKLTIDYLPARTREITVLMNVLYFQHAPTLDIY